MISEMKCSGVGWLGDIPARWQVHRIANLYSERNESGSEELPILTVSINSGISDHEIDDEEQARKFVRSEDKSKYKKVYPGDLAYNMMRAWQGAFGAVRTVGMISPAYVAARPNRGVDVDSRYMEALLRTPSAIEEIHRYSRGITDFRLRLYWPEFKSIQVCVPPIKEQKEIANYLDKEGARIDAVIDQIRASIEEYKKLKQVIISSAVTKGIIPGRQMKESGFEWIGEIPNDWRVMRFKYFAMVKSNLVEPEDYGDYPQVSPENIEKGSGKILFCKTVSEAGVISGNHLFYQGQILYTKIRPKLNKIAIAPFDGLCSADMYPIETVLNIRFLLYAMLSDVLLKQVSMITEDRVKMPKINKDELGNTWFAIPSLQEQNEIVEYLDKKTAGIDVAISQKGLLLGELESYKKSLIYEYVTGKKEVPA